MFQKHKIKTAINLLSGESTQNKGVIPDIKFPLYLIRDSFYLKAFVRNGKIRLIPGTVPQGKRLAPVTERELLVARAALGAARPVLASVCCVASTALSLEENVSRARSERG